MPHYSAMKNAPRRPNRTKNESNVTFSGLLSVYKDERVILQGLLLAEFKICGQSGALNANIMEQPHRTHSSKAYGKLEGAHNIRKAFLWLQLHFVRS